MGSVPGVGLPLTRAVGAGLTMNLWRWLLAEGIRIEGLPPLQKILKEVGSLRPVKRGLGKGAVHLKGKIAKYPTQLSPVNPKWRYDRGIGSVYVPTGRVYRTSETHGRKWTVRAGAGGLEWTIGNNTSYGPFLQDKDDQTRRHKVAGWQTTEDVIDQEVHTVNRKVKEEVDRALEGK